MGDWLQDSRRFQNPRMLKSLVENGVEQCMRLASASVDSHPGIKNAAFDSWLVESNDTKPAGTGAQLYFKKKVLCLYICVIQACGCF